MKKNTEKGNIIGKMFNYHSDKDDNVDGYKDSEKRKHFLQKDGTIIAKMYSDDIHFEHNGKYVDIDNTLIKKNEYYENTNNLFKVKFKEKSSKNFLKYNINGNGISISLMDSNISNIKVESSESNYIKKVIYGNIFDGIDLEYIVTPTKVKENIIINEEQKILDNISFFVETDLCLELNSEKEVSVIKNNKILFFFEVPYVIDSCNKTIDCIYYKLNKVEGGYILKIIIEKNKLDKNIHYPIIVDPTISTYNTGEVYDTYIYPGDSNDNRGNQDVLKVGVERRNGQDIVNRTLIKFELPTISTGSQIYEATLNLVGYNFYDTFYNGYSDKNYVDIHQITQDWSENNANWDFMNDKYNPRIESSFYFLKGRLSEDYSASTVWDITSLVQKWYSNEPNYGIMLKSHVETYKGDSVPLPKFYSKNNNVTGDNPKPTLLIVYRNQNGLENYMDFKNQTFSDGIIYENTFNGNLISIFQLTSTIGGNLPAYLSLIYNTNDVVLNKNIGYGLGWKFNLHQTISPVDINGVNYLEYLDESGTLHYFYQQNGKYIDEDNLNLTIVDNSNEFVLTDKENNVFKYLKNNNIGYLTECIDNSGKKINILYNSDMKITKIIDSLSQEINIEYNNSLITISSSNDVINLQYNSGKLQNINYSDGIIQFNYNDNKCISSVIDKDGTSVSYEYYQQIPYRIKKVTEIGLNNEIGTFMNFYYNYKSTTIIDNKMRVNNINYNETGIMTSSSYLKNADDLTEAYSFVDEVGKNEQYKNKLTAQQVPIKYVKNYLNDSSFENDNICFTNSNSNITMSVSSENANNGTKSLSIENSSSNTECISENIEVPKNSYYTFSAYVKNNTKFKLALSYIDSNNNVIKNETKEYYSIDFFDRKKITIFYPDTALSNLTVSIYIIGSGIVFLDDLQLEKGEVANAYNFIDNSDFSNGLTGWNIFSEDNNSNHFEIATLNNQNSSLKIKMDPLCQTTISRYLNIKGNQGDTLNLSFWFKNEGIKNPSSNIVLISFDYINPDPIDVEPGDNLNPNANEWQFYSKNFKAMWDYNGINIIISQSDDANNLYLTNFSLFKSVGVINYEYDTKGNVIGVNDIAGNKTKFDYNNENQIKKITNPMGHEFVYEYDSNITDKLINGLSNDGLCNRIKYDDFDNAILSKISIRQTTEDICQGLYSIRLKGTNKYLRLINHSIAFNDSFENNDKWQLITIDGHFKIRHSIILNSFFSKNDDLVKLEKNENASVFDLIKNNDGTYFIKLLDNEKYIKYDNGIFKFDNLASDDNNYKFYFEIGGINSIFTESNLEFSEDGRFLRKYINSDLNEIKYDIDNITGFTNNIIDNCNNITHYTYDDMKRICMIELGDRKISFNYNSNGILTKISSGRKQVNLVYDSYLNLQAIKIGDDIELIRNNNYSNNGNLRSVKYGNNNIIEYEYDDFDRIVKSISDDDNYIYKYGNNGELLEITSNNNNIEYWYDYGKNLKKFIMNNFEVFYTTDKIGNLTNVKFGLDVTSPDDYKNVDILYDKNAKILKRTFDGNVVNYYYDELGRITKSSVNNVIECNIKYLKNGRRATEKICYFKFLNDEYKYVYDKRGNVTHIYLNEDISNKYYYNSYNELIKEKNYIDKIIITYDYDISGNIISKKIIDMADYSIIKRDRFEYNNEWEDELEKYNDILITYDEIGNPINIGNDIHLTWQNGRQLKSYSDGVHNILFNYSHTGQRLSKTVDNITTKYYSDGNALRFEKWDNNVLYYIYDDVNDVIALSYNDSYYYYIKNALNDIVGIMDEEYNIVARYRYDSWGNIISITDSSGNDLSNVAGHIANINPFRYRSYYYDKETKLYYLNSRYYNPKWGRFINTDSIISIFNVNGFNLFKYADNNPIRYIDLDGNSILSALKNILHGVAVAAKYVASKLSSNKKKKKTQKKTTKTNTTKNNSGSSKVCSSAVRTFTPSSIVTNQPLNAYQNMEIRQIIKESKEAVKGLSKEEHYNRNQYNAEGTFTNIDDVAGQDGWYKYSEAICHSFNGAIGNTKWVKETTSNIEGCNGSIERVFDSLGHLVVDPNNFATFNFCSNKDRKHQDQHFKYDVATWIMWGNNECDSTTIFERAKAYYFAKQFYKK